MSKYQAALDELKRRGYVKAVVEFSGGNDDGGVDQVTLIRPDGKQEDGPEPISTWDFTTQSEKQLTSQELSDKEFNDLLEQPVYDEYYTFAGDFSVHGTVTFDVKAGTVKMTRSEQIWNDAEDLNL